MAVDIVKDLKKYIPIFQSAHEQAINEADTSSRVGKFLEDVLGYDIFTEVSKEHMIKDRYVDYAIKLDGKTAFLVEIKQAGTELKEKHIEQANNYASNDGVPWVVLTNGACWQMYHLTFDEGIQSDLIWSADLLGNDIKETASMISLLHKKSIVKGEHEKYYAKTRTLSPKYIIQAIFYESTLKLIRAQLKKMTGIRVDEDDLVAGIKRMISTETWEQIGDVKVKRKKKTVKADKAQESAAQESPKTEDVPQ